MTDKPDPPGLEKATLNPHHNEFYDSLKELFIKYTDPPHPPRLFTTAEGLAVMSKFMGAVVAVQTELLPQEAVHVIQQNFLMGNHETAADIASQQLEATAERIMSEITADTATAPLTPEEQKQFDDTLALWNTPPKGSA